ncbi:MAG TPA: hypothetical protein PK011_06980 [Marinagarivorans sp.]|nr:hypothetical protein [Marinagarivorans sp.]
MHTEIAAQLIPTTQNPCWGFWGTLSLRTDPAPVWAFAIRTIAQATGEPVERVRMFLDHRWGRHFADAVENARGDSTPWVDAVRVATDQWMKGTISRACAKDFGVPQGTPQLVAYVHQAANQALE